MRGGVASARVTGIIHPGQRRSARDRSRGGHTRVRIHVLSSDSDKDERSRTTIRSRVRLRARCVPVILCRRYCPTNRYLMNMTNAYLPANDRALEAGRFCATIDPDRSLAWLSVSWNPRGFSLAFRYWVNAATDLREGQSRRLLYRTFVECIVYSKRRI